MGKIVGDRAGSADKILVAVAFTASVGFGAALPGFCLVWGEMMDSVG